MRSVLAVVVSLLLGCGSSPSPSPPAVAPDEVATPTETAPPPPQQAQAQAQAPTALPQQATRQAMPPTKPISFPTTCEAIARDLETLRPQFAQLTNYRAVDQKSECHISYEHDTLPPSGRGGGWSAGVPRPNANGIFLYIGIWDPNGKDAWQLDTQPMTGNWWIGNRRVTLIVNEGDKVKSADGAIRALLERHGMQLRN